MNELEGLYLMNKFLLFGLPDDELRQLIQWLLQPEEDGEDNVGDDELENGIFIAEGS